MATSLKDLTRDWGPYKDVGLYLDRCQHDTPNDVVRRVWKLVAKRRKRVSTVLDFGAGDGRFAIGGAFDRYVGYEIDSRRSSDSELPSNARIVHSCAFSSTITDADMCIGNPPFVRNQDLPLDWRKRAAVVIKDRTGVEISGLANAWQYFAFLGLASTKPNGLVALVMPYEWVSRPSAKALRKYVTENKWGVAVYRLLDETFDHVLTTSSITLIDKRASTGTWNYFEEGPDGSFQSVASPTGAKRRVMAYTARSTKTPIFARRGLSPGTQDVLTLTEQERIDHELEIGTDVVKCVTSLRQLNAARLSLTASAFDAYYKKAGARCWLIRTDKEPSRRLQLYLHNIPRKKRRTSTCMARETWWKFAMPAGPPVLVATGFRGARPKAVRNEVGAVAVGSVSGVFGLSDVGAKRIVKAIHVGRFRGRIVAHSNGLRKLEVGQLETFIASQKRQRVGPRQSN